MSVRLATKGVISDSGSMALATKGILDILGGIVATLGLILNPTFESTTVNREIVLLPYDIKPYP